MGISSESSVSEKILQASPATALANKVFPVPGGPTSSAPLGIFAPSSEYLDPGDPRSARFRPKMTEGVCVAMLASETKKIQKTNSLRYMQSDLKKLQICSE